MPTAVHPTAGCSLGNTDSVSGDQVCCISPATSEIMWLAATGLSAGTAAGLLWRVAGRTRWGSAPFVLAVLAAADLTGHLARPRWYAMIAAGGIVTVLAGAGAVRILADPRIHWAWVAAAAVSSAAGVWAGVPETGPALVAAGGIAGLAGAAALTGAHWEPAAGLGLAAVVGWAALSGAAGRPWAALGGALCTGVAPWFALRPVFRRRRPSPRPWLLAAHVALVVLAARWIGVHPHAGWGRVAVVALAGMAVAMVSRRQA